MNQKEINYLRKYYGKFMGYQVESAPIMEEEDWNSLVDSADVVMKKIKPIEDHENDCGKALFSE